MDDDADDEYDEEEEEQEQMCKCDKCLATIKASNSFTLAVSSSPPFSNLCCSAFFPIVKSVFFGLNDLCGILVVTFCYWGLLKA